MSMWPESTLQTDSSDDQNISKEETMVEPWRLVAVLTYKSLFKLGIEAKD